MLLSCNFAGPDLVLNCMQNLPVDETIVDMHDFVGPDLGLNCMQYLPVDETIVDKVFKH